MLRVSKLINILADAEGKEKNTRRNKKISLSAKRFNYS